MKVASHGVGGYRSGCRCSVCRSAETLRKRDYRARAGGKVVVMPSSEGRVTSKANTAVNSEIVGSIEQAVLDEAATLSKAAEQPAMVACALAMAQILDNDGLVATHPQAARQLQAILRELHCSTKKKRDGRLAAVQRLTTVK